MSRHEMTSRQALRLLSLTDTSSDPLSLSRRRFLQSVAFGIAVPTAFGAFDHGWGGLLDGVSVADALDLQPIGPTDGILVLVTMYGGNDGLNTVVPYGDGDYYRRRGSMSIAVDSVLPVNDEVGLHPALVNVKELYDAGSVAIVQGVGYPSPSLSHFSSMFTWMNGGVGMSPATGWIGRWLDGAPLDLFRAMTVGESIPLHLVGRTRRATAVGFRSSMFGGSTEPAYLRNYAALRAFAASPAGRGTWHDMIASTVSSQLDVAERVAPLTSPALPSGELPAKLEMAARLINANFGTRVVDVGFGSFDTHANELVDHGAKLAQFDEAVGRFFDSLSPEFASRVTMLTWSEFGRTITANASGGTDHGTASSLFVIGRNVKGGLYGERPSLAGSSDWDRPVATVDFRSVYSSVVDGWLGGGASSVVGPGFEDLGFFRAGPGTGPRQTPERPVTVDPLGSYVAIVPQRVYDSRNAVGEDRQTPVGPGERVVIPIRGVGQIPPTGVVSVVLNATVTRATSDSYITVWPTGRNQPATSNLNPRPGRTVPNMVVVPLGDDGTVSLFNERGFGHVVVDVVGYCSESSTDRLNPLSPSRILDTRTGVGARKARLGPGETLEIPVAGVGGVPVEGASAVVINVTVAQPSAESYLTIWPTGQPKPVASSLNMIAGQTVPNLVFATVGDHGRVSVYNSAGSTHVIADLLGYFGPQSGHRFASVQPFRVLDTRSGLGAWGPVQRKAVELVVPGLPSSASALLLNVTATDATADTFVTVWPSGVVQPDTSNLNLLAGETTANSVLAKLGVDGRISFANAYGSAHLIADVLGYFVP